MPKVYEKPALTFAGQLKLLKSRGLMVEDDSAALQQLASISYYRLSAYWYPFWERSHSGKVRSRFQTGTCFSQIIELYEFDRQLRTLVMDAIERVEVAARTRLTYVIGHRYGPFGHTDPKNFHPKFKHGHWLAKLEEETERSSDEFIRHYRKKYSGFPRVPVWMLTEVMSFGALSFFYKGLKDDKKAVADYFDIHHKRLGVWLHTLTYVRNVCAHHSRLWNRKLAIRPDKARQKEWLPPITPRNDRLFYVLLMLRHLLKATGNATSWHQTISDLLGPFAQQHPYRLAMGLPENWREHPLWK